MFKKVSVFSILMLLVLAVTSIEGATYLNGLRFIGFVETYNNLPASATVVNSIAFVGRGTNTTPAGIYRRYPAVYNSYGVLVTASGWVYERPLFSDQETYVMVNEDNFSTRLTNRMNSGWVATRNPSTNFTYTSVADQLVLKSQSVTTNVGETNAYLKLISGVAAEKIRVKMKIARTNSVLNSRLIMNYTREDESGYCLQIRASAISNTITKLWQVNTNGCNVKFGQLLGGTFSQIVSNSIMIKTNLFYSYEITRDGNYFSYKILNAGNTVIASNSVAKSTNGAIMKSSTNMAHFKTGKPAIIFYQTRVAAAAFAVYNPLITLEYIRLYNPIYVNKKRDDD